MTRYIAATTPRDLEIFLSKIAVEFSAGDTQTLIDLYTDEPLVDEQVATSFQEVTEMARLQRESPSRRHWFTRRDPLMGVQLDLTRDEHVTHFSRLAHRVINAEVWQGDHQLFGTVESPVRVWVDLSDEAVERALAAARACGAAVHMEPGN
ncbi:hypothetical protein [Streptomyces chiangmaiensis]|uniref:Uncharacterized protein n=1 Tax=Streptomyces chiangmaiensis TaxID=766497 RepID=A0ABU7FSC6_9ACTN|nr:hypothetical protein [Streptomyces chiangmaiensis]MED7827016.1 hypothetical protein [Streptomyces chiangmaiensis]